MFNSTLLNHIDALKARLDCLRPLPPELVDNLREVYDIRLTYHSNAIKGNTLTQSETQIVVEKGITIGGKPLKDHLEAINHVEAIDFIRDLAVEERAISEWDIRQIHGLVCKGERGVGAYRTVNVMAAGSNYRYPDAILVPDLGYIDAIVAWQSDGDDTQLKETIAKCVESSLMEILSLAGEA